MPRILTARALKANRQFCAALKAPGKSARGCRTLRFASAAAAAARRGRASPSASRGGGGALAGRFFCCFGAS